MSAEEKEELNGIIDEYIEEYIQNNPEMSQEEKNAMIKYIKDAGNQFITTYQSTEPYDTETVGEKLKAAIDSAIETRETAQAELEAEINEYTTNVEGNFENLYAITDEADDDYVTGKEFEEMKEAAAEYVTGMLLSGEIDEAFLNDLIGSEYTNNREYKNVMHLIESMNNTNDPEKKQEYLEQIKKEVEKMLGSQDEYGQSRLGTAVVNKQERDRKAELKAELSDLIENMVENYSNQYLHKKNENGIAIEEKPTLEEVETYRTKMNNMLTAFIENYSGDGTDIETEFQRFVGEKYNELNQVNNEIENMIGLKNDLKQIANIYGGSTAYTELKNAVDKAGYNITEEEKAKIIEEASALFIKAMYNGGEAESIVGEIYPGYESDANYQEAMKLYNGLETSATPAEDFEKIKALIDFEKIKALITEMLNKAGVEQIISAVENEEKKNVNLSTDILEGIWGYNRNDTYGGDDLIIPAFEINSDGSVKWTDQNDVGDIERILSEVESRIKNALKEQLGDMYSEADVEKWLDKAVLEALAVMGGTTSVKVSDFTNRILEEFNIIATRELKNTNSNRVDRTQVLADAGALDDYRQGKVYGGSDMHNNDAKDKALRAARAKLEMLRSTLIEEAKRILGDDYNETEVSTIIDQSINDTVNSYGYDKHTEGFFNLKENYSFNTVTLYNNFFNTFESMLMDYKNNV